jgi:diguanylate cyclase (GGDEF)-like protein
MMQQVNMLKVMALDEGLSGMDDKKNLRNNFQGNQNIIIMLVYRWLVFLFSAVLCITCDSFVVNGYEILESLAVVAVYNGAVTAYCLNSGKNYAGSVVYIDSVALMLLVFFSGGIGSELYIFSFLLLGLYGINNETASTFKLTGFISVIYIAVCFFSDMLTPGRMLYSTLVIRLLLFFMASFAISGVSCRVKRYDEMRKKEFRLARTDKLTGLANRHYFDQKVAEEAEYASSFGTVINILIFDLDNFKGFNDTYGHISGDKLLRLFSDIIMQCIRKTDIPVRYGGEEFMILIRDMDIIIAKSVGDRIRRHLEKQNIHLGEQFENQKMTVSCGIAQFPTHSKSIREVIEMADRALYHAKEIGKNIVVCYDEIDKSREEILNESKSVAAVR